MNLRIPPLDRGVLVGLLFGHSPRSCGVRRRALRGAMLAQYRIEAEAYAGAPFGVARVTLSSAA